MICTSCARGEENFTTFFMVSCCRDRNAKKQNKKMAGALGIEPRNGGTKNRCLTAWLRPNTSRIFLKRADNTGVKGLLQDQKKHPLSRHSKQIRGFKGGCGY